ncbi:RNA 3'-terminal phosphate cyclase [Maioricimonas rarisocia]|uniref:RNA 3'-terminal phosphate cyclase n=1 Tax=Maioricimonas rarisocia TaxID=2528026 RepID=A0A517Z8V8_9PLAN|nr:RNA 3'-terminal phosphate cyclase [Maioricimonas rarisocia]QDU38903.1 RNA 3'-terminal phosphate cyclase [Maioricimonas rarisocia]
MIEIDGAFGEGGGQIVRSSLTLALATGQPVRIFNIRAGRKKPGLLRQHLTSLQAAARVGNARVEGAAPGSREIRFWPGPVTGGTYHFSVGSAGSTTLVLQTILPVLLTADAPSNVVIEGGTHNPFAPPFPYLDRTFIPLINRLGPQVSLTLHRPGFFPAGGGKLEVAVEPAVTLGRLELTERGDVQSIRATVIVASLPRHIAERELKVLGRQLDLRPGQLQIHEETRSHGPGNIVLVEIEMEELTEVVTGFGERGKPAERVARDAAREANEFLEAEVPIGQHLADQLLLPLALGSGGVYLTGPLTPHTETNIDVIRTFTGCGITTETTPEGTIRVEIAPGG